MTRRIGYAPLVLAVGWIIVELALQPVTVNRGLLAGTVGDGDLMRLVGGVLGYVFVAFLIVFVNAQLLSLIENIVFTIINRPAMLMGPHSIGWIYQSIQGFYNPAFISNTQSRAPPSF